MTGAVRVRVDDASQVPLARAAAGAAARTAGLPGPTVDRVVLAASELAENLHRHAVGGELLVLPGAGPQALQLVAVDRGPGVERFERCLVDGFSTVGTMGTGLGAARRIADGFDAVSEPGRGTVVLVAFDRPGRAAGVDPEPFDVGTVGFPVEPETVNGDGWAAVRRGSRLVTLVADGLGHGPGAEQASRVAAELLPSVADLDPVDAVAAVSRSLRSTRGAAVTLAVVDLDAVRDGGELCSCGLGNVSLLVAGPDAVSRRVVTSHGTAGGRTGTLAEVTTTFPAQGLFVLHTDGLTSRWDLTGRVELLRHSAVVVAAALWRDHARGTDDSLVVVGKAAAVAW